MASAFTRLFLGLGAVAAIGAVAWYVKGHGAESAAVAGAPGKGGAPVSVTTAIAKRGSGRLSFGATGTVVPLSVVDVRAQVSSLVQTVHVKEGQFVSKGQLLVSLDDRADKVAVAKAQAQLEKDLAQLADAQRQLARSKELVAQKFVTASAVDTAQTQVDSLQATVAADRAAVQAAQVALGYDRITAPGAGRLGAIAVYPGSLVQPSGAPLLTIMQVSPIAVAFNVPQRYLSDALARLQAGDAQVRAFLPEAKGKDAAKPLLGRLSFVDNQVDASSGTIKVKAEFDNTAAKLWPGAFVNVALDAPAAVDAIEVPLESVVQGGLGKSVFVVDEQGQAAQRPVEVLQAANDVALVTGLKGGERVIVEGRQSVRPGSPVVERKAGAAPGGSGAQSRPAASAAASGAH